MSNVIKYNYVTEKAEDGKHRIITAKPIAAASSPPSENADQEQVEQEIHLLSEQKQELEIQIEQLQEQLRVIQEQIVQEKEEAQREIEQWRREQEEEIERQAASRFEEVQQKGFQEGYDTGYQQIQLDSAKKLEDISKLIELAYQEKQSIIASSEPILLQLSVKIAEKIIHRELQENKELFLHMVQSVLKELDERKEITIQVSPYDYSYILPFKGELEQCVDANVVLKIVPEHTHLKTGDCMIHTSNGSLDVTIDSQLSEVKKHLLAYQEERAIE